MSFMSSQPTIAMITDYGSKDGFSGIMKGILYKTIQGGTHALPTEQVMPPVVDITHEIEPFNIAEGAWILYRCYQEFPENTIFISIVDPGVGKATQNKLLLAWPERKQYFIGPDNGIFTPILEAGQGKLKAFSLENEALFRQIRQNDSEQWAADVSKTFHGRDVYAPVAGHLAHAIMTFMCEEFLLTVGQRIDTDSLVRLEMPQPKQQEQVLTGHIRYSDNFGNLTTDIPGDWLESLMANRDSKKVAVELPSKKWIGTHLHSYAEGKSEDSVFVVTASTGTLELALFQRNARQELNAKAGDPITIRIA